MPRSKPRVANAAHSPALDITECPTAYLYEFDVPGFGREGIRVQVDGNVLSLTGTRSPQGPAQARLQVERPSGAFVRRVVLPDHLEVSRSRATIRNGVLQLWIPKRGTSPRDPASGSVRMVAPNGVGESC